MTLLTESTNIDAKEYIHHTHLTHMIHTDTSRRPRMLVENGGATRLGLAMAKTQEQVGPATEEKENVLSFKTRMGGAIGNIGVEPTV